VEVDPSNDSHTGVTPEFFRSNIHWIFIIRMFDNGAGWISTLQALPYGSSSENDLERYGKSEDRSGSAP
jgi:hypothetical protein